MASSSAARFARVVLAGVVFLAVLELCTQVDDALTYGAPIGGRYSLAHLFISDAVGRRGRPDGRFEKWQLNSLGYRGPELRAGTLRVLCLGASETFGMDEAGGREYPRQLQEQLTARLGTGSVEVVNVAMPGQTIATAARRVPETVDQIHPVLAVIYPSVPSYIWFPLGTRGPPGTASSGANAGGSGGIGLGFDLRIADRLYNLLKEALPGSVQALWREVLIRRTIAKQRYPVMDRVPEENVRRFHDDLADLIAALRKRGVEPVLVTHATALGDQFTSRDRDFVLTERKFYPMLKEEGFLDMERRMNGAIRAVAAEQRVVLVEGVTAVPPGPRYFGDYSHFTSAGAERLASRIADALVPMVAARLRS